MQEETPISLQEDMNNHVNSSVPIFPEEAKQETEQQYKTPQKSKSGNLLIYASLFLIFILILGFFCWKYVFGEKLKSSFFPVAPTPAQVAIAPTITLAPVSTESAELANWKTYRNEKYGFEFKYPQDWNPESSGGQEGISVFSFKQGENNNDEKGMFSVVITNLTENKYKSVDEWFDASYKAYISRCKNGNCEPFFPTKFNGVRFINGEKSIETNHILPGVITGDETSYYLLHQNNIFELRLQFDHLNVERNDKFWSIFDKILSTFRFVEKKTVNNYISQKLGISFSYAPNIGGSKIAVEEKDDKIYLGIEGKVEEGQWVQVFQKDKTQSLEDAIRKQFLSGISSSDCFIVSNVNDNNYPSTYKTAEISFPKNETSDEPWWAKSNKCPPDYSQTNGIRYFLEDTNHPSKFVFFSIGQSPIYSEDKTKVWQQTIEFFD